MTRFEGEEDVIGTLADGCFTEWFRKQKARAKMIALNGLAVCIWCGTATVVEMLKKLCL